MLSLPAPRCVVLLFTLVMLVCQPAASSYAGRVDIVEQLKELLAERARQAPMTSDYEWSDYGDDAGESDRFLETDRVSTPLTQPLPCPGGERFCSTADDYPEEYIRELLKQGTPESISDFFSIDDGNSHTAGEDQDVVYGQIDYDLVGNKIDIGPSTNEENLCPTRIMSRFPRKAEDKNGALQFIVNQEKTKQPVVTEECVNKDDVEIECQIPGTLLTNYKSYCKQKYSVRALVTVVDGKFRAQEFEFPSACCCVLIKT